MEYNQSSGATIKKKLNENLYMYAAKISTLRKRLIFITKIKQIEIKK